MGEKKSEVQQGCSRLAKIVQEVKHSILQDWVHLGPGTVGKLLGSLETFLFPSLAGGRKQGTEGPRMWQILAAEHWPSQSCLPAALGCSVLPPSQSLQVVHASPHLDFYSLLSAKGFWKRNSTIIAWSAQDLPPPHCFELKRDHTPFLRDISLCMGILEQKVHISSLLGPKFRTPTWLALNTPSASLGFLTCQP